MESDATENAGCRSFVICPMQSIELARNGNDAVEMNAIDKNAGKGWERREIKVQKRSKTIKNENPYDAFCTVTFSCYSAIAVIHRQ
jgi:hypothetical protein